MSFEGVKRRRLTRRLFGRAITMGATVAALGPLSKASFAQDGRRPVVLITGSSRGIGLEFARQYAESGWKVIATSRNPSAAHKLQALAEEFPDITLEALDVLNHSQIDALARKYENRPIDILINNAGIGGGGDNQVFGRINYDVFDDVMRTNVLGPLKMAEAFIDHVAASGHKKIVTITSGQGSITETRGRLYFYRASKTGVNMAMRTLSKDIARRGVIVVLTAPGATDTDFMDEVRGRIPLGLPEDRVGGMIDVIDNFAMEQTGTFVEWDGRVMPW